MTEPEILPPIDPQQEDLWRRMWREHAIRMRIMDEEMAKYGPRPRLLPPGTSWGWKNIIIVIGYALLFIFVIAGFTFIFSLPPQPLHVIITQEKN